MPKYAAAHKNLLKKEKLPIFPVSTQPKFSYIFNASGG